MHDPQKTDKAGSGLPRWRFRKGRAPSLRDSVFAPSGLGAFGLTAALVAALTLPTASSAFTEPENERGFDPDKVYQMGDVDHVSMFNGNVLVTVPVGGGLTLTYNSNLWNFEHLSTTDGDPGQRAFTRADPAPGFDAGAGWTVLPGQLQRPSTDNNQSAQWTYIDNDGGAHGFYRVLHREDFDQNPDQPGGEVDVDAIVVGYTTDSSYLRMQRLTDGAGHVYRRVEMPDGSYMDFQDPSSPPDPMAPIWMPIRRVDAFGNTTDYLYSTEQGGAFGWDTLRIRDRFDRDTVLRFETHDSEAFPRTLTSISVPKFARSTSADPLDTATWTFQYGTSWSWVARSCPHKDDATGGNAAVEMPMLDRITAPDGSEWRFPEYNVVAGPGEYACSNTAGRLKTLQLPTKGKISWTYQGWVYPMRELDIQNPNLPPDAPARAPTNMGVHQRTYTDRNGVVLSRWTYEPELGPIDPQAANYMKVTVTDMGQNKTEHFFSVDRDGQSFDGGSSGWRIHDYGLPFSRHDAQTLIGDPADPSDDVEVYLSKRIYDTDGTTLLRSEYVRYESDGDLPSPIDMARASGANRRQVATKTVDHAGAYTEWSGTVKSDFDGLGHYRKTVKSGSLIFDRTTHERKEYNPGVGTYEVNALGNQAGSFQMPTTSEMPVWSIETSDFQETRLVAAADEASDEVLRVETTHHPSTGALLCKRVLADNDANPQRTTRDLFTLYDYNGQGELVQERLYGGDVAGQSVPTGSPTVSGHSCQLAGLGSAAYRQDNTHAWGRLTSSHWVDDATGAAITSVADYDIDGNTGRIWRSYDTAGWRTEFDYDGLGRMTSADSEGSEQPTVWQYSPATASTRASASESQAGSIGVSRHYLYDDLGRPCVIQSLEPSGLWNRVRKAYDQAGRLTDETVVESGGGSPETGCSAISAGDAKTTYSDFDGLGRARQVTAPDGSIELKEFVARSQVRTRMRIGTGIDSQQDVWSSVFSDADGRKRWVEKATGRADEGLTTYRYNAKGKVEKTVTGAESSERQLRFQDYDGRGFRIAETLPELGASGGGTVTYLYDAMGNVIEKSVAGGRTLRYDYDRAGRLVAVHEVLSSGTRPLKELYYHRSNVDGWPTAGKLRSAKRHNYLVPPGGGQEIDYIVSESHRYEGLAGRRSSTETRISAAGFDPKVFEQTFDWNDWGLLASSGQPRCLSPACLGSDVAHVVNRTWSRERPVSVSGTFGGQTASYASSIAYHPNGLLAEVTHGNGMAQRVSVDSSGMPRPSRITAESGGQIEWDSGTYAYDGASNIVSMGSDDFAYDGRNRLSQAILGSVTGSPSRSYDFDTYGNLVSIDRSGSILGLAADPASNRLTASGSSYDSDGNLLRFSTQGAQYVYDGLNMLSTVDGNGTSRGYAYTADNERLFELDFLDQSAQYTVRGPEKKPLRRWRQDGSGFSLEKDYVYRGDKLLVTFDGQGERRHHFLDHLGTPRYVAASNGSFVAQHTYFPFGEAATDLQDAERLRFTGHERDDLGTGTADDLDYMHARYYSPYLGRFLSVDPARDGNNLYAYVRGNPMMMTDPDGMSALGLGNSLPQLRYDLNSKDSSKPEYYESRGLDVPPLVRVAANERLIPAQHYNSIFRASIQTIISTAAMYAVLRGPGNALIARGKPYELVLRSGGPYSGHLIANTTQTVVQTALPWGKGAVLGGGAAFLVEGFLGIQQGKSFGDAAGDAVPSLVGKASGLLDSAKKFVNWDVLQLLDLNSYPMFDPTSGQTTGDIGPEDLFPEDTILQDTSP